MSTDEVIEILRNHGIQVVMKPVALIPTGLHDRFGRKGEMMWLEELDVHEAYKRLTRNSNGKV